MCIAIIRSVLLIIVWNRLFWCDVNTDIQDVTHLELSPRILSTFFPFNRKFSTCCTGRFNLSKFAWTISGIFGCEGFVATKISHPESSLVKSQWPFSGFRIMYVAMLGSCGRTFMAFSFNIFRMQAVVVVNITGFLSLDKFLKALSFPQSPRMPSPRMLRRRFFGTDLSVELWCCCSAFWMSWEETTARRNRNEATLFILVNKNNVIWRLFDTSNQNRHTKCENVTTNLLCMTQTLIHPLKSRCDWQ